MLSALTISFQPSFWNSPHVQESGHIAAADLAQEHCGEDVTLQGALACN